jgi:putative endonuclease
MTNSLSRRFLEHVRGKTKTTRAMVGLRLIYKEEYDTVEKARKREIYLKTAAGRKFLKQILQK